MYKSIWKNSHDLTFDNARDGAVNTTSSPGLVVNVGSMSGMFETPLLSVYSASKAYVHTLTEALRQEYAELGIHFQVIIHF